MRKEIRLFFNNWINAGCCSSWTLMSDSPLWEGVCWRKEKESLLWRGHACSMATSASEEVKLREVHTVYFLEITSPSKAMTEASMNRQWRSRFEAELIKKSGIWRLICRNMTSHLSEYDVSFVRIWRLTCRNMTSHLSEYDVSFVGIWRLIFQSFVSYEGNCRLNSGGQAPSKGYALLIRKRNLNTKKPLVDLNKGQ